MKNDSIKFAQLSSNTTMTYKDKVLVNDSITLYKYLIEVTDNDVTSRFNIYLENFVENLDKINKEKFVKKLIEELNEHPGLADIYIGNVSVLEDGTTTFSVNEEVYNSFYDVITSSNDNTNESVTNKNAQTHTQNNQNYHNSNYEDYSIPSEGAIKWDCDALAEATYDFMSGCSIFNESVTSIANQIRVADIPNDINGALLLNSANKILDVLKEKTDYLLAAYVAWGNSIKDFYIEEELQKLDFELTELQNSGALDEKKENIEQRRKLLLEAKNSDKSFVELYYDVKNTTPVELTEEQIKEYYNTEEGTKELYNKYLEAYEDEAMAKSAYILFCEENGIMLTGDMKKIVDERNTLYNKLVSQGVYNETQIAQKMMSFDAKNNLSIEVLNQYKAELEQNKQEYIGSASNKKEEERLLHEWEVLNGMVQDDALLDKLKTSGKLSYSEQLDAQRAALEEAAKEGQSLEEIARNGFITLTTGGILNVGVLALTFTQGLFGFGEGVYDAALTLGASDFIQNTEKWLKGEEVSPFKHTQDVNKMFKDYWSEYYQSEEYKKEFQEWYQKNNESYDPMGEFKLYVENKFKKEYGSSSTIYSKAVEEAIETGDYSNLDNIDLNTLRNAAKQFDTMDKVAISYVNDFAQHYIYDKDWYKEIEQYSLIKHDGILGQVSLQIGRMAIPIALSLIPGGVSLGALGTLSIGATASSAALGISAFGSAAEGAYTDGATYEQGVKYATLSAATEMLTEKLFSGVAGIGEGWLDNAVASGLDKIMYKISPKLSDNLIAQISKNLFVKGVGEGVEEVTSDLLDPIWQWMTYKSDYELKDVYKENVSLKSLAQTFLISALTGIFMGGAEIGRNVNRFNTQLDSLRNLNKLFPNVDEYANAALAHMINMEGSTYSKVEIIDEIINTVSNKMADDVRTAHPVPDLIDSLSNIKDGSSQIRIGGETITLSNEALYNILDSARINNNKLEINLDGEISEVIGTNVLGDGSSGIIDISESISRVLSPETITEISFSDAKAQSRFMNSLFNSAEASLQQMLANPDIDALSKEKIKSLIEQMHNMKSNGNFSENIHNVANLINNMYNTRMNSVFTILSDDMVVSNPVRVTDELYKYTAVYKDADGNYKTVTVYSNSNINYDSIFTDPATIESEITRAINANKDGDYVYIGKPTIESTGKIIFSEEIGVREKIKQIESGKDVQIKEDVEIIDVSGNTNIVEDGNNNSTKIIPPEPTTTLETKAETDTTWTETDRTNFLREHYSSEIELASDTNALKDMLTKATGAESPYLKASDDVIRGIIDAQASGLDLNVTKEIQALLDATKRLKSGEVILNRTGVLDGEMPVVISKKIASKYGNIVEQAQIGMDSGLFTKEGAQQIFKLLNEQGIKSTESIENLKTKIVERYLNDEIQLTPEAVQRLTNITKRLKPGEVILNMSSVLDGEAPVVIPNEMTAKYGDIVRQTQNALDSGVFNEESAQQIFELLNEQGVKSTESIERLKFKVKHNLNTALLEINSDVFSDSQAEISIQESHLKRMETIVDSIENKLKPRLEDELAKLEEDYESQRKLLELEKSEKLEELKVTTKNTLSEYDMELDIDMKYKYGDKFRTLEQDYKDAIDRLNREYESGIQKIFTKEMSEVRIGETKAIIESVSPTVKEVDAIIGFTEKEIMDIKPGEDVGYSGRSKVELLDTLEKLKTKRIEAERVARDLAEKESKIDPVDFSEGGKYDGSQRYILGRNRAPLSTETIERMVKDIGVHPYESLSDNESFLAKKFGISVDQLRFELDKKIRDFVGEGYVGIRKGVKSLSDILDSGYIKNQFETKTSSATKDGPTEDIEKKHRDRSRVEHNTFGLEYDTPYADRPIYGMMFTANLAKLKTYIKTGPGWWYGSGEEKCVIILNKDAVRKTTSITMGDSFGATYASTLDNPTYSGGITMSINERFKSLEEFRNADLTKIFNDADRNYLECQIYGRASHAMTPEVVKEVIFTELPSESLIEKLEKANIPWRVL